MTESANARSKAADGSDFVSLTERLHWLNGLRVAFGAAAIGVVAAAPQIRTGPLSTLAAVTGAYLIASLGASALIGTRRRLAFIVIGATLLLDGAYLASVTYWTGGLLSPLRFVVLAHVAAVTLAGSYRTGFKVAAWHSLLLFVTAYAQASEILDVREMAVAALPGEEHFWSLAMLGVGSNLAVALVTAAFSSINEREIREQKVDLDELSSMVRRIDASADATVISRVLLDDLARVFGFTRGAVFGSSSGDLTLLASRDANVPVSETPSDDEVVGRALDEGSVVLVRGLDPAADPMLASLLPDARNVAVVRCITRAYGRSGSSCSSMPARTASNDGWSAWWSSTCRTPLWPFGTRGCSTSSKRSSPRTRRFAASSSRTTRRWKPRFRNARES
jgi:two-component system cell cycle response regulator